MHQASGSLLKRLSIVRMKNRGSISFILRVVSRWRLARLISLDIRKASFAG